jgi:hypothetical protein
MMEHNGSEEAVATVIAAWPHAAKQKVRHGSTPLHVGVEFNAPAGKYKGFVLVDGFEANTRRTVE